MQTSGKESPVESYTSRRKWTNKDTEVLKPQRTPVLVGLKESQDGNLWKWKLPHPQGYKVLLSLPRWRHRRNRRPSSEALAGVRPTAHCSSPSRAGPLSKNLRESCWGWLFRQGPTQRKETVLNHLQSSIAIKQVARRQHLSFYSLKENHVFTITVAFLYGAIRCAAKQWEKIHPSAQVEVIIQQQNFAGFCCFCE